MQSPGMRMLRRSPSPLGALFLLVLLLSLLRQIDDTIGLGSRADLACCRNPALANAPDSATTAYVKHQSSSIRSSFSPTSTDPFTRTTLFLPMVAGPPPPSVLIAAVYADSRLTDDPDEALMIQNVGRSAVDLAGWEIASGSRRATVPLTVSLRLAPGSTLWCAAQGGAFELSFGYLPACEWEESRVDVPNLHGTLSLSNSGGVIQLRSADGKLMDTLAYGDVDRSAAGWSGPPATLYDRGAIGRSGQIFFRKTDAETTLPVDSNRAEDWAGDLADVAWGRRVRWPGWHGWDAGDMAQPVRERVDASVSVLIGPEGLYEPLALLLGRAVNSIDLSIYTLEHPEMTGVLVDALKRGVRVRILLEGGPPGGISDLQKWCVTQIEAAGGEVRYFAVRDDAPRGYRTRYAYAHAKYGIIDDARAFNGTDNFNRDSMPVPDGTPAGGRRGIFLVTDAEPVVAALRRLFGWDWAPDRFMDLRPFEALDPKYGAPPADFSLPAPKIYPVDDAPFDAPTTASGAATFAVLSAPENALRPDVGLLHLLAQAGAGDVVRLMQLYEHKHWGPGISNPIADPNPRLQATIKAARRGAKVRLLLDTYFDDPEALRSNRATATYVNAVARSEKLDLEARLGNPAGGGIHAKILLIDVGAERWSAVGSLNGSESSHKLNREVVVLTDQATVYERLVAVFEHDWSRTVP